MNVLPDPVLPYVNKRQFFPVRTSRTNGRPTVANTPCCVLSGPMMPVNVYRPRCPPLLRTLTPCSSEISMLPWFSPERSSSDVNGRTRRKTFSVSCRGSCVSPCDYAPNCDQVTALQDAQQHTFATIGWPFCISGSRTSVAWRIVVADSAGLNGEAMQQVIGRYIESGGAIAKPGASESEVNSRRLTCATDSIVTAVGELPSLA